MSAQWRVISSWSPAFVIFWSLIPGFLLAVYYPLPPENAHVDKLLPLMLSVLVWAVSLLVRPTGVQALLGGRIYRMVKVICVNFIVFALVGECVLRITDPILARHGLFGDNHMPSHLKPHVAVQGSIQFSNSRGFRDRERIFQRTGHGPRVVVLGDSFTYGAGVGYDETFVTLLERALQASFPHVEMINLGVPGWDPPQEFYLLKEDGIRFAPDLVMLNLFVGNDIMRKRGYEMEQVVVVAGQGYFVHSNGNWPHDTFGPDRWYLYHNLSYLVHVGANRVYGIWENAGLGSERRDGGRDRYGLLFKTRAQHLRYIDERSEIYVKQDTPLWRYHWDRTREVLQEIQEFLRARNIPFILVAIPDQVQVDRGLQQELLSMRGATMDSFDFQRPQRWLRVWCIQNAVRFIDLQPAFEADVHPGRLYLGGDIHWSATGHTFAAQVMVPILQELFLSLNKTWQVSGASLQD
jgi:hypothetical protein